MMTYAKHSEKEIEIFNGIIDLIKEGANPYAIKVSDIAIAANVGKGTIYDYFNTKEEAISKAIIYNLNNEVDYALSRILSKKSFKDRFYEVLKTIADGLETNVSTLNMLLSTGGLKEFYEFLVDDKYDLSMLINIINQEIGNLLELGFKEGIINTDESKYYQAMVIKGAILGFSHYISGGELYKNISKTEAMNTAYKILVRSLN